MENIGFLIWGIGERGKDIAELISKENLVAFVDRNQELQGKWYAGIPIISPKTYEEKYTTYPILVTPEGYEEEIASEVQRKGCKCVFTYGDSIDALLGYYVRKEYIREEFQKTSEHIYLYGITPMSLFLNDILRNQNKQAKIIASALDSIEMKLYVFEKFEINQGTWEEARWDINSRIILTKEMQEQDLVESSQYHGKIDDYHDLMMREELYYYPEIKKFKGIHLGQRCFIVATGPSLRMDDLDRLKNNHELCIGVNSIYKAFTQTQWRPDYYMVGDASAVRQWKEDIIGMDVKDKFIADTAWRFEDKDVKENFHKWHMFMGKQDETEIRFSSDFAKGSYWGRTIVYDGALQLAAYMGFSEIYLLGVDMSYLNETDRHYGHFYDEPVLTSYGCSETVLLAYETARCYAEQHNIKIYNATRGGKLEIFERVDFDSLF